MAETGINAARDLNTRRLALGGGLQLVAFVVTLRMMGREFVSDSGFGVWTGAWTRDTSQWMFDPYTCSHILHGVFLYWLLLPLGGRLSVRWRFLFAALIEAAWEITENTPLVIDRYRGATASRDCYGDSILNSTFDLAAAMVGFWIAAKLDWRFVLAGVVLVELVLLVTVRDNLTLNILMLLHPFEAIKQWQVGA